MEDVLEVYHRPFDPARAQVCLDEASKQLLAEGRAPLPIKPGELERIDGEYTRQDTAAIFMVCEPLAGRRHVFVRAQRKRLDFAAVIKTLCDELHPEAEKIVLVMDQLIDLRGVAREQAVALHIEQKTVWGLPDPLLIPSFLEVVCMARYEACKHVCSWRNI